MSGPVGGPDRAAGRHVLVTGGSRGIGAAIVRRLLDDGHRVSFTYLRDEDAARRLTRGAAHAIAVQADVGDPDRVEGVFTAAEAAFGPVAGLVNNAGVTGRLAPFLQSSDAEMRAVFDVNVFGVAAYSRAAVSRWVSSGTAGAIVNVGSTAAATGSPGEYVGYAASKAAVETLTRGWGRELAPLGIRVVNVAPGTTDTQIHAAAGDPSRAERVAARAPMGRVADPAEIANVVVWALSDQASYVTAVTIPVSGGL